MSDRDQKRKELLVAETHVDIGSILSLQLESLVHTEPLKGLTDEEVRDRLEKFGYNGIVVINR